MTKDQQPKTKDQNTQAHQLQMVDLYSQYLKIKEEVDSTVLEIINSTRYIGGPKVMEFQQSLEKYLGVKHVIPCANGTDALQIALMALGLKPGDEVIVPAFTYVATAEVIALLRLKPIMVDVDPDTFNLTAKIFESAITPDTRAVVPVHLFGQTCDMEDIMSVAEKHNIYVVEDNAQAIGSDYTSRDGTVKKAGCIGHIGTTSFFPAKNLGCYGDGGAIFTNSDELDGKLRMIANHGQSRRYYHDHVGVNSRLDALQAAILNIKLKYLDDYARARQWAASEYDKAFAQFDALQTPARQHNSTHVFHQYTLRVKDGNRDNLAEHLSKEGIPNNIYYPVPLYEQNAFSEMGTGTDFLPVTDQLCKEVISLPMHTEMDGEILERISGAVATFFS